MIDTKATCVLIVDDSPENIRIVADILSDRFEVKIAKDGYTALEIMKEQPFPDLVLLDIMMPGMDGYEVCGKLKEHSEAAQIPVIFITAKSQEEDIIKGFEMGGVDYITKPFNEKELLARVRTHIELKAINDHLEQLVISETRRRINQEVTYKQLFDSLSSFISIISEDFHYLAVNKKYTDVFNMPENHISGRHIKELMGESYFEAVEPKLASVLIGKTTSHEAKITLPSGETIDTETTFSPFCNDSGEIAGIIVNMLDSTEKAKLIKDLKKKEQSLIQQKKLADMGHMINAIAHQWRQPLNALGLIGQEMVGAIKDNNLEKHMMSDYDKIHMQLIDHLSKTIDDFRHFFKSDKEITEFEVVYEVIHLINLIVTQFKTADIDIKFSCSCGKSSFKCVNYIEYPECEQKSTKVRSYLGEFKQAVLNLIYNAYDSIKDEKEKNPDMKGFIDISLLAKDEAVYITITDNGTGVPEDVLPRVFDPYYTTKDEGKGTGIGLYMAKMVVEDHMRGKIDLENGPEGGAVVSIFIPVEHE